jgi:AraC-like DNA-binding protein
MNAAFEIESHQVDRTNGDQYTFSALADIANEWGYGCEVSGQTNIGQGQDDLPLVAGFIATRRLSGGVNVCASDLTTLHDNDRVGLVKRSLMIALNLDGSPVTYAINDDRRMHVVAGRAVVLSATDDTRIASSYRRGESSRILVVQACLAAITDSDLAEYLDAHLRETTAKPLILSCRACALAQELFSSKHTGVIGRLLTESCALELLVCAITAQRGQKKTASCRVHPRDIAKIQRVRDTLLANLDAQHHLCDLARDVGMSTSTLKCKFVAVVGQPVFQFLRDKRLDRARAGMQREGWTVSQAAYYVGYRHATNFATAFRRRFGVSPILTRRSQRVTPLHQQAAE